MPDADNRGATEEVFSDFDLGPDPLTKPLRIRAVMARRAIAPVQGPIDFDDPEMQRSVHQFLRQLWNACLASEGAVVPRQPGMRPNRAERIDAIPSHKSPPDDGITYAQIDRISYRVTVGEYTGAEIRAWAHPPIGDDQDLWLTVLGEADRLIRDGDTLDVRNSGLRLWTHPRWINAG